MLMTNYRLAITNYLNVLKIGRSANTYKAYSQALKQFYAIVGNVEISVDSYINFLRATKDANPSTKELQSTAILRMLKYNAADDATINIAAFERAKDNFLKKRGKRIPIFDNEALEKIITYCTTPQPGLDLSHLRDRAFILTLADSGARISEACNLRRGDIDRKEARAFIIGKGDKQAVIHFSDRSIAALNAYLSARKKLDGTTMKPLASLPLFARHDKGAGKKLKPVQSGGMWFAIKAIAEEAGVDKDIIRPHDFRHYFVTSIWLSTGDIKLAQELARHNDIGTTSRYTHIGGKIEQQYAEIFNNRK
jgi:integrase/recombinase XerC